MPEPFLRRPLVTATTENLRALGLLAALPFKIHTRRTLAGLSLLIVSQLSTIAAPFALKLAVDGVTHGNHRETVSAIVVFVAAASVTLAGSWASFTVRMGMNELTTLAI